MNLLALGLLVTALLLFAAFHFLPGFEEEAGWLVWLEAWEMVTDPETLQYPQELAMLMSFFMLTLLIVASPFLIAVFRRSRLAWWLATLMSGLAMFAFLVLLLGQNDPATMGAGGWCLVSSPVFHLCGMLMIRGQRRDVRGMVPER